MIAFKDTVRVRRFTPALWHGVDIAHNAWTTLGHGLLTVTSANDSRHGGHGIAGEPLDPHYTDRAVDVRLNDILPLEHRGQLVTLTEDHLSPDYQVFHESPGTPNEHMHLQYSGAI